jgi:hypothetical protein
MDYALEIPFGIANLAGTFGIDRDFAISELPSALEKLSAAEAFDDCVVLYFKDGETKHVGRMKGDRVVSKWGRNNPVYEHAISEVPAGYGDEYENL